MADQVNEEQVAESTSFLTQIIHEIINSPLNLALIGEKMKNEFAFFLLRRN